MSADDAAGSAAPIAHVPDDFNLRTTLTVCGGFLLAKHKYIAFSVAIDRIKIVKVDPISIPPGPHWILITAVGDTNPLHMAELTYLSAHVANHVLYQLLQQLDVIRKSGGNGTITLRYKLAA